MNSQLIQVRSIRSRRAEEAGLSWPLPEDCDDFILERRLFPAPLLIAAADRPLPDWNEVARELPLKGVTLFLLWHEYKEAHPLGYQYSRFCDLHREWAGRRSVWMRQDHKAGERMFVDYAGGTVPVVDRETGDVRQAQIFVAVLGASNYTFAEATWTQGLEDWVGAHVRAFEYFGGVAALVVPDNLWSGVSRACRYEPGINSTYAEMLAHYGWRLCQPVSAGPGLARIGTGKPGPKTRPRWKAPCAGDLVHHSADRSGLGGRQGQ